ncbi:MAG: hypothetical protein OXI87_18970 [Albidovulum sp.]|nr:hypothetical protein [Albidovulum sp.]
MALAKQFLNSPQPIQPDLVRHRFRLAVVSLLQVKDLLNAIDRIHCHLLSLEPDQRMNAPPNALLPSRNERLTRDRHGLKRDHSGRAYTAQGQKQLRIERTAAFKNLGCPDLA